MKNRGILSIVGILLLLFPLIIGPFQQPVYAAGMVYYVDANNGDDENPGTSPSSPWKSLDKLEQTKFQPGDTIRLHEDSVFSDTLFLEGGVNGEGSDETPIILESYGDTGGRATINGEGGGRVSQMDDMGKEIYSAVTLYNASNWTVRDLAITNHGDYEMPDWGSQGTPEGRVGFYVLAKNNGLTKNVHVDNLKVTDVNGSVHAKNWGNGGIYFAVGGTTQGEITRFDNISITNCHVEDVTRTGISVGATVYEEMITDEAEATTIDPAKIQMYGHTNVLIENNYVQDVGGDGIVPFDSYQPLIQYNVSNGASKSHENDPRLSEVPKVPDYWQVNAGVWPWLCYYPNFQFNEALNTVDNYDGEGFDCDSGTGTIYQYNYSHDNQGGFMLICSPKNFNSLIRYNISENDRKHLFLVSNSLDPNYNDPRYPGITEEEIAQVYNNTFYTGVGLDVTVMSQEEPGYVNVKNNIFYNEGTNVTPYWQPAHYGEEHPATINYDHNLYYGYTNIPNNEENPVIVKNPNVELTGAFNSISLPGEPQHERAVIEDELVDQQVMAAPGTGGIGLASVSGYQLVENSPAINRGVAIADNGGRDYFGNILSDGLIDIGAHEYSGETPPVPSDSSSSSSSTNDSSSSSSSTSSTDDSCSSSSSSTSSTDDSSSSSSSSTSSTDESSSSSSSTSSTNDSSSSSSSSSSSTDDSSSSSSSTSSTDDSSSSSSSSTSSTDESSSSSSSTSSTNDSSSSSSSSSSSTDDSSSSSTSTSESSSSSSSTSESESSSSSSSSSELEESSSSSTSSSEPEESSSSSTSSSEPEESSSSSTSSSEQNESSSTSSSSSELEESSSSSTSSSEPEESSSSSNNSSKPEESSSSSTSSSKPEESSSSSTSSSEPEESSSSSTSSSKPEESSSNSSTSSSKPEESSGSSSSSNEPEESSSNSSTSSSKPEENTSSSTSSSKPEESTSSSSSSNEPEESTSSSSSSSNQEQSSSRNDRVPGYLGGNSTNRPNGTTNRPSGAAGGVSNKNLPSTAGGKAQPAATGKQLPKTGNEVNNLFVWFGLLVLAASLLLIRKVNKENV